MGEWVRKRDPDKLQPVVWAGIEFDSKPDRSLIERVLTAIVQRHQILRSEFVKPSGGPGELFNRFKEASNSHGVFGVRVRDHAPVTVSEGALHGLRRDGSCRALRHDSLTAEVQRRFQYDAPPLIRATLFTCDETRYLLSVTIPHLIADGLSMRVLLNELAILHGAWSRQPGAPDPLPVLTAQYNDFAVWQRQQLSTGCDDAMSYWRAQLAEFMPEMVSLTEIPYADSRQAPRAAESESDLVGIPIDPATTSELRTRCQEHRVSMYTAWLAAIAITLRLYTNRERIALVANVANRTQNRWRLSIGWFSNSYTCGIRVSGRSGTDVLSEARRTVLGALEHQAIPHVVQWRSFVRERIGDQHFSISEWIEFDYVTAVGGADSAGPSRFSRWSHVAGTRAKPALAICIADAGRELTLRCRYPTVRFSPAGARQVLTDVLGVMRALMASADAPVETYRSVLCATSATST